MYCRLLKIQYQPLDFVELNGWRQAGRNEEEVAMTICKVYVVSIILNIKRLNRRLL
jgi:hypothetical protein